MIVADKTKWKNKAKTVNLLPTIWLAQSTLKRKFPSVDKPHWIYAPPKISTSKRALGKCKPRGLFSKFYGISFRCRIRWKCRWVVEQDFRRNFPVNFTWFFAFSSGLLDWTVLILVCLKWSLQPAQVSRQICHRPPKLMTSQVIQGTQLRAEQGQVG